MSNSVRGLLTEYGITIPKGRKALMGKIAELINPADTGFSVMMKETLKTYYEMLNTIKFQEEQSGHRIMEICKSHEICQKLMKIG